MKPYSEMTKEELAAYTKEAISYCKENNLYRPGELVKLKQNIRELITVSVTRMELHKRAQEMKP